MHIGNMSDIDEKGFQPVPAGKYIMRGVQWPVKPLQNGNGQKLSVTYEIVDGEFRGRRIFENYVFDHPNSQTVDIALGKIKQWLMACGAEGDEQITTDLIDDLGYTEFLGTVGIEQNRDARYADRNVVKKFEKATEADHSEEVQQEAPTRRPWKR